MFLHVILLYWFFLSQEVYAKDCRCVPGDDCWPSLDDWHAFNLTVNGRLSVPESPVQPCLEEGGESMNCKEALKRIGQDPFWLELFPGATQSTGQVGAWNAYPSSYAVEVMDESDIVSAVNFAKNNNLRLVVKGTGHDYYGRSSYPDSLLIWTRSMKKMEFHDEFIPIGSQDFIGTSAVTLEAGLTWMEVYAAASIDRDLYVQGGGCTSVGVIGWHIGGGYGSFSKKFGSGPANILEAKIVTANGDVLTASEFQNEDLFYAIRGGGHGFGVIVSLTVRTHPLPDHIAVVGGVIKASDEKSNAELVEQFLDFYNSSLLGPDWGEQFAIMCEENGLCSIGITMMASGLTKAEAESAWLPMKQWAEERDETISYEIMTISVPGKLYWNKNFVELIGVGTPSPYDPLEPERGYFYNQNLGEISGYWMWYVSRYMRMDQILDDVNAGAKILLDFAKVSGYAGVHTNKAQFGASSWAVDELDKTPLHPSIKDSFGLMITAMAVSHYSPLVEAGYQNETSGYLDWAQRCNSTILEDCQLLDPLYEAFHKLQDDTPNAGSYFNEADYFEENFQENFWGHKNYNRLLRIKNEWDPKGLFYCHKCVGSEDWEEGGMCRV